MDVFEIELLSSNGLLMLAALALVPALLVYAISRAAKQAKAGLIAFVTAGIGLAACAAVAWPLLSTTARLADDGLRIDGGWYDVTVPYADIDGAGVRTGPEGLPRPRVRTNGIGLPGGALGWFRADARRVFAAYNGGDSSVYVPTRGDFDVLVSPGDAARFVEALAQRTGEPARR